ncbi:MAG: hypothetical protein JWR75_34 [Devosia sp.]|nr:hypothetical protein [Devosia sp.]
MGKLAPRSAFAGLLHSAGPSAAPGVLVREETGLGLATVFARAPYFPRLVQSAYGIIPPETSQVVSNGAVAFIGTGPGKWLALSRNGAAGWRDELATALGVTGSVIDQSDGFGVLRVSGEKVRATFEKGFPVDLHPSVFKPRSVAVTLVAHIGVTLWQIDDAPTYELAIARSFAGSFAHWLTSSAAEFGLRVEV